MLLDVHGREAYCYTGGKPFDPGLPTLAFIHGAQNDHSVWGGLSRHFAGHGHNVLALDLPGHGRSAGPALTTVEAMAAWLLALLDAAGASKTILAGHSMGSLIALEAACQAPGRVAGLALLGTSYPMKVSDALLASARDDEAAAIDMVALWSHSTLTPALNASRRLMQRLSERNPDQLFHTDFSACNAYANGERAAASVACPTLFVLGRRDVMTPARSASTLTAAIKHGKIVNVDAGHAMMAEQPDAVLEALAAFAAATACT
jgi:pimeloyl-ACP methyl ester carboxylesterase